MQTNLPPRLSKGRDPQPFFEQLQQEMEQLFDRFRGYPPTAGGFFGDRPSPVIDMAETDEVVEVTAEIPGVASADLDVTLNGDLLMIKGEKSDERTKEDKNYHLHERSYGSFSRQIPLGFTPDDDAITAKFSDGVLKLTIAKPPAAKSQNRKIAISEK
ncbi:MAG: Hsp20/alpha crystallin family protein [Pseudomonadota bacterium]